MRRKITIIEFRKTMNAHKRNMVQCDRLPSMVSSSLNMKQNGLGMIFLVSKLHKIDCYGNCRLICSFIRSLLCFFMLLLLYCLIFFFYSVSIVILWVTSEHLRLLQGKIAEKTVRRTKIMRSRANHNKWIHIVGMGKWKSRWICRKFKIHFE